MNQTSGSNKTKQSGLAYSVESVAAELNVSTKTIRRLLDVGRLKRLPGIRHIRIPAASVEQYLASAA